MTGGTGFLGSALVKRLVAEGHRVRVFDDNSRGRPSRLADIEGHFEYVEGDIRDPAAVDRACNGVDTVCHLAFVNGTEFFYSKPDLVLDVALKGIINVLESSIRAARARADGDVELGGVPGAENGADRRERGAVDSRSCSTRAIRTRPVRSSARSSRSTTAAAISRA